MSLYLAMPLWVLLIPLLTAPLVMLVGEHRHRLRTRLTITASAMNLVLVFLMLWGVRHGHDFMVRFALVPDLELVLAADALAMLLITLSAVLWLATTIYAIAYLQDSPHRARFFAFFSLCMGATMGIALAGNLFTFFIFFEMLTLATWPLVVHRGTDVAMRAGRVYLAYTLGGGAILLLGIVMLYTITGPMDFIAGGTVAEHMDHHGPWLIITFLVLLAGVGVKASLVPLHGWLPTAMVAPAPVSALLHAVAVVKAGAFGIVRIAYDVYGIDLLRELNLGLVLVVLACVTIIYGSVRALFQTDLKRRLAFSTVSQVSYIALGVGLASPLATVGGLVHLVHQGLMKITLFFCAGNYAETHGIHDIRDLDGIGRRMPWTTALFTLGAMGMIGVPPLAGFVSKWYLGMGAISGGQGWVVLVLIASTLLNAMYFLPLVHRAWFRAPASGTPDGIAEAHPWLLWPTVFTALAALGAGLLAGLDWSPLGWAQLIAMREYGL